MRTLQAEASYPLVFNQGWFLNTEFLATLNTFWLSVEGGGAVGSYRVEGSSAATHCRALWMAPTTGNYPTSNVRSAEVEKSTDLAWHVPHFSPLSFSLLGCLDMILS